LDRHNYYWLKVEDSLVAISNHCNIEKNSEKKNREKEFENIFETKIKIKSPTSKLSK